MSGTKCFLTCSWRFLRYNRIRTIQIQIGKKNWDLETYRKNYKSKGSFMTLIGSELERTFAILRAEKEME